MTKETFNKSVDVLLDAYNERKLFHGNCSACAVGNLLGTNLWANDFCTVSYTDYLGEVGKQIQEELPWSFLTDNEIDKGVELGLDMSKNKSMEKNVSEITKLYSFKGFTRKELMKIEFAFENSVFGMEDLSEGEAQLIGLKAVIEVMKTMTEEDVDSTSSTERLNIIAKNVYNLEAV